jgi:hypothetical protein
VNAYDVVKMLLETDRRAVVRTTGVRTIYRVVPLTQPGCDCEDCRAGRHLYELERWQANRWKPAATSLQAYGSAEKCRQKHYWGIRFEPNATWEDGAPVLEPEDLRPMQPDSEEPGPVRMVPLNTDALGKSVVALARHWFQADEAAVRPPNE